MIGGMGVFGMADEVRTRRPETRVLFLSGFTDEEMIGSGSLDVPSAFLPKPFTPEALARRVRSTLDA